MRLKALSNDDRDDDDDDDDADDDDDDDDAGRPNADQLWNPDQHTKRKNVQSNNPMRLIR